MVKAVIFDCYGVLVRDGWLPFCELHFGSKPDYMIRAHELNRQADRGMIEYGDYVSELSELAGIAPLQVQEEIATNPMNEELFHWIRADLKSYYKIGLLSNAAEDRLSELFGDDNVALFDETVLSYQIGVSKPDPRSYEAIVEKLGTKMTDCLLIDDQPYYCEGARAVGMSTIIYRDNHQLRDSFKDHNIALENE